MNASPTKRRRKPFYARPGEVCHGSFRLEDLIPEFLDATTRIRLTREERSIAAEIRRRSKRVKYYEDVDTATEDRFTLENILNAHAPPYMRFGSHPGNDSDFGFYLPEYALDDFEGLKVSDLAEVPAGHTGEVILVNDRGNTTLYNYTNGRCREVWGIV